MNGGAFIGAVRHKGQSEDGDFSVTVNHVLRVVRFES